MAFVEDFTDFFDTDDFAVDAQILGKTVSGIFEETYIEVMGIEGLHPVFTCALEDVKSVQRGDALSISSASYHVAGVQKDGTGMVGLVLEDQG
tara:strand:+ start:214 stop:492 length:279 start_codon:yes stop_codon:yes gene_type:complete